MNWLSTLICNLFHRNSHAELQRNYSNQGRKISLQCQVCDRSWEEN